MYAYCANNPVMYLDPSGWISRKFSLYDSEEPGEYEGLPDFVSIDVFYTELELGLSMNMLSSEDKLGASIGVGVIKVGFKYEMLFRESGLNTIFNPNVNAVINIIYFNASLTLNAKDGFGFDLDVELFSIEGTLMINDNFGVKGKIRLGIGATFKVNSINAEIGFLWWEITLYFG